MISYRCNDDTVTLLHLLQLASSVYLIVILFQNYGNTINSFADLAESDWRAITVDGSATMNFLKNGRSWPMLIMNNFIETLKCIAYTALIMSRLVLRMLVPGFFDAGSGEPAVCLISL